MSNTASSVSNALRARVKQKWPARYRDLIGDTLSSFDSLRAKRNAIAADDNLSTQGKAKRIHEHVVNEVGPSLTKAMRNVGRVRQSLAKERQAAISKATGGELDAVALAVCAAIKGLPQGEVARLTIGPDADPRVVRAVLSAPVLLSGVSAELRNQIERDFVSRYAADDLGKISIAEEALSHVRCQELRRSSTSPACGMQIKNMQARTAGGRERNCADVKKPFDPEAWAVGAASL